MMKWSGRLRLFLCVKWELFNIAPVSSLSSCHTFCPHRYAVYTQGPGGGWQCLVTLRISLIENQCRGKQLGRRLYDNNIVISPVEACSRRAK